MIAEERLPNHPALTLIARVLFTLVFVLSGVTHFTNLEGYVALMPDAIPFRGFWVVVSGLVELAGAGMILFDWRPRLGGWLIVLFLIPVTVTVHGYEMLYAEGEAMRAIQQASFVKGFSLIGAALLITQVGATHRTAPTPS